MDNITSCASPFICLIRHGETEYSAARRYNGRTDIGLTSGGEQMGRGLAPVLGLVPWEAVLCSDLRRARHMAELAGFESPRLLEALRECDYGEYEGKTTEEILALRPGWDFWVDGCPQGENPEMVANRLRPLLRVLMGSGGRVLVFSHSHIIRILAALLVGLPPDRGVIFSLEPGRLNIVRLHRGRAEVALWNDGQHIPVIRDIGPGLGASVVPPGFQVSR